MKTEKKITETSGFISVIENHVRCGICHFSFAVSIFAAAVMQSYGGLMWFV